PYDFRQDLSVDLHIDPPLHVIHQKSA
ncbi:AraC family transcriptional regulator, partial [Serratia marcescens]